MENAPLLTAKMKKRADELALLNKIDTMKKSNKKLSEMSL